MNSNTININKLKEKRIKGSSKFNFNTRLNTNKINAFETAYGILFPDSYKQFMEEFNGGMFLEYEQSYYIDMTDWEPDGPKWSSFYFYTLEELQEEYIALSFECNLISDDVMDSFPLIPICNTPNQETIMLVSQNGLSNESPVFISNDISDMSTYVQIDENFGSFLGKIIDHEGFPNIKVEPGSQLLSIFIYDSGILNTINKEITDDEKIIRSSAMMILNPKNGWNYYERGSANENKGLIDKALEDYNKAIKLEDDEPLFYYCRGNLILTHGSPRKALIDMDIAVKQEPNNNFYRYGRANTFLKLGKLPEALADCNFIIEIDDIYEPALSVRYQVYKAMGEDDLAQKDADLLNDLFC